MNARAIGASMSLHCNPWPIRAGSDPTLAVGRRRGRVRPPRAPVSLERGAARAHDAAPFQLPGGDVIELLVAEEPVEVAVCLRLDQALEVETAVAEVCLGFGLGLSSLFPFSSISWTTVERRR